MIFRKQDFLKNNYIKIAIIGRPNVGKSSLYNCFVGRREAIVDSSPGVTRDRKYFNFKYKNIFFSFIDTGGISDSFSDDVFYQSIEMQSRKALNEADILLFVVEIFGLMPDDYLLMDGFRKSSKDIVVLINKCDNQMDEYSSNLTYELNSIGKCFYVSAVHRKGIDLVFDFIYSKAIGICDSRVSAINNLGGKDSNKLFKFSDGLSLDDQREFSDFKSLGFQKSKLKDFKLDFANNRKFKPFSKLNFLPNVDSVGFSGENNSDVNYFNSKPSKPSIKIAIIGRPNVGKSTLLNKILGEDRSIVSDFPGTTRDAIEETIIFGDYDFTFIDTAGIRKRSRVNDSIEYYSVRRSLSSISRADVVIHLIDCAENITEQDKKIAAIVNDYGKAMIIVINKWEIIRGVGVFEKYIDRVRFKFAVGRHIPVLTISAKTGMRLDKLMARILGIYFSSVRKIQTSKINDFLQKLQKNYSLNSRKNKIKVYYATQIGVMPVRFLFFINNDALWTNNYSNFFINKIRKHFSFEGVPVVINVKKSSNLSREKQKFN